jgi:hypothetical protein
MTASLAYDAKRSTGYRFEQLAQAFDRVRNARDWKAPIQSVIPAGDRDVVEKAVLWFTDQNPAFEPAPGEPDRLLITAPGYRGGLAGDP